MVIVHYWEELSDMSMSNQSDPSVGDVLLRQILPLRHVVERGHNQAHKVRVQEYAQLFDL